MTPRPTPTSNSADVIYTYLSKLGRVHGTAEKNAEAIGPYPDDGRGNLFAFGDDRHR